MENHGVRYGLMAGVGAVLLMFILKLVDARMMLSYGSYLVWIIYIACMVKAGNDTKRDNEGFMSWGEALKPTWITYLVASLIAIIFQYVLMNFIDPSLLEVQKEMALEMAEKFAGMFGAPEDAMDEISSALEDQDFGFSPMQAIMGWGIGLIFPGFILAAIISLIIRRDRPAGA